MSWSSWKVVLLLLICTPMLSVGARNPGSRRDSASGEALLPKHCGFSAFHIRITGGLDVPMGMYPWIVALVYEKIGSSTYSYGCGGALINENYVLTAAHCLTATDRSLVGVRLGSRRLTQGPDCTIMRINNAERKLCAPEAITVPTESYVIHEDYKRNFGSIIEYADIGLVRLQMPLDLRSNRFVKPICLPPKETDPNESYVGKQGTVAGWGRTTNRAYSLDMMQEVEVPFVDRKTCYDLHNGIFNVAKFQLCAGGNRGQDSCSGDSGGPLMISNNGGSPYTLVGIVSFGTTDCTTAPGVYTSVAYYRDWIVSNMY